MTYCVRRERCNLYLCRNNVTSRSPLPSCRIKTRQREYICIGGKTGGWEKLGAAPRPQRRTAPADIFIKKVLNLSPLHVYTSCIRRHGLMLHVVINAFKSNYHAHILFPNVTYVALRVYDYQPPFSSVNVEACRPTNTFRSLYTDFI